MKKVVIRLERTACFGSCPVYKLEMHGDGTVFYSGISDVRVIGDKSYKIPVSDMRKLLDRFRQTDFFSLNDKYEANVTDNPTTMTTIVINGKTKQVIDYVSGPQKLKDLENYIDEIADVRKLTQPQP